MTGLTSKWCLDAADASEGIFTLGGEGTSGFGNLAQALRIAAKVLDPEAREKVALIMSDTFNQQVALDHADECTTIIPTSAEDWTQDADAVLAYFKEQGDE